MHCFIKTIDQTDCSLNNPLHFTVELMKRFCLVCCR